MNRKAILAVVLAAFIVFISVPMEVSAGGTSPWDSFWKILFPSIVEVKNPVSNPTLWGQWIVEFETRGKGELLISAYDRTFFEKDIELVGLYCDDNEFATENYFSGKSGKDTWFEGIDNGKISADGWQCSGNAKLILRILETGHHYITLSFNGQNAYAENLADCTGTTASPCHMCDTNAVNYQIRAPDDATTTGWFGMTYGSETGTCGTTPEVTETWTNASDYFYCPQNGWYDIRMNASAQGTSYSWEDSTWNTSVYYCAAPGNINATSRSYLGSQYGGVYLEWVDNSPNEDGFKIERSNDMSTWTEVSTEATPDATNHENTNIGEDNMFYYFRARAYGGSNYSPYSDIVDLVTSDATGPSIPEMNATNETVNNRTILNWTREYDEIMPDVLNVGLELHMPLESNDNDISHNHYTGKEWGTLTYSPGISGNALDLDATVGEGIIALYNATAENYETQFSISLWFKSDTTSSGDAGARIFSRDCSDYFCLFMNQTGSYNLNHYYAGTVTNRNTGELALSNPTSWHHSVSTWDMKTNATTNGTFKWYIDGELFFSDDTIGAFDPTERPIVIGYNTEGDSTSPASSLFYGLIDDFRVYDRVLSEDEIRNMQLVGQWHFDEGSGTTAKDATGFGNACTFTGAPSWVDTPFDKGLDFNGTDNNNLNCGNGDALNITNEITIEAWVKGEDSQIASDNIYVVGKDLAYALRVSRGSNSHDAGLLIRNSANSAWYTLNSGVDPIDGTWHHVLGTFNRTELKIYVDGDLKNTSTITEDHANSNTNNVVLGAYSDIYGAFNGTIDEVRIWRRALTASEIQERAKYGILRSNSSTGNYQILESSYTNISGLIGMWHFDNFTGTVAPDSSDYGNDATLYNSPTWESGKFGQSLYFDGVNDWANITSDLGNPSAMTMMFWFKVPDKNSGNQYFMDARTGGNWYFLQDYVAGACTDPNGNICFDARVEVPSWAITNNMWHHVAVTEDATETKIYLDGILMDTGTGEDPNLGIGLTIGARYTLEFNNNYTGNMDEIRIYNRVLSQDEIRAEMTPFTTELSLIDTGTKDVDGPTAPAAPSVSAASDTSLQISWTNVSDAGGQYYYTVVPYDKAGNPGNMLGNNSMAENSYSGTGYKFWEDASIVPMWSLNIGDEFILEGEAKVDSTRNAAGGESRIIIHSGNDTTDWEGNSNVYSTSNVVWTKFRLTHTISSATEGDILVSAYHWPDVTNDGTSYFRNLRLYKNTSTGFTNFTSSTESYQVDETTGGTGGTDSGWIYGTYTDSGLNCFTQYTYRVRAKDAVGNIGDYGSTTSEYPVSYYTCQYGSGAAGGCLVDEAGDGDTCYYTGTGCPSETCYVPGYVSGNDCYYDAGASVDRSDDCVSGGCTGVSTDTHPACTSGDFTGSNANCWTAYDCLWNNTDPCAPSTTGWNYTNDTTLCSVGVSQCCPDTGNRAEGVACGTTGVSGTSYDRDTSQARCEDGSSSGCTAHYWAIGGEVHGTACCEDDAGENKRTRVADSTMDNSYATDSADDACCVASNDCVDSSICYDNANVSDDVDGDGDTDFCNAGTWYDCDTDSECTGGAKCAASNDCNSVPTQTTPSIVATTSLNRSTDNITCSNQTTADVEGDTVTNIYNWYKDGTPLMILNMPMDTNFTAADNTTAGVDDYSIYGNDARLGNTTTGTQPVWNSTCKIGGCYNFDGVNDYVDVGDDTDFEFGANQPFSISSWVYRNSNSNDQRIVSKRYVVTGNTAQYELTAVDGQDRVMLWAYDGAEQSETAQLTTNAWHHIVAQRLSDGTLELYIDGELINNTASTTAALGVNDGKLIIGAASRNIGLGNDPSAWRVFNGSIDDIRIYNTSLDAEQIYQLWADTKDGYSDSSTIVHTETIDGESWKCEVFPNDHFNDGTALNSTTLNITDNYAPTHTTPTITTSPGINGSSDNITCSNQTTVDIDGNDITNIYNWYKDGTPLMILNMPFDTNTVSTAANAVNDYSIYENDGTISDIASWNGASKCVIGGCYEFDGENDYITVSDDPTLHFEKNTDFTIEAWINLTNVVTDGQVTIVSKGDSGGNAKILLKINGTDDALMIKLSNTTDALGCAGSSDVVDGTWHHILLVVDRDTSTKAYVDGVEDVSCAATNIYNLTKAIDLKIGVSYNGATYRRYFNGTMDGFKIYSYAPTAEQAYQMWAETKDGYTDSTTIVHTETAQADVWKCEVWPNDATTDGTPLNSTTLTINTPPEQVVLSSPADGTHTTDITPTFQWSVPNDDDGDPLTYTINITCFGGCSDDNRYVTNIGTNSYTASDMQYFGDDNYYYNWSVHANDGKENGSWSSEWNLTINTNVTITMVNDLVEFGENKLLGYTDNTTDNVPSPFSLRNIGNCMIDVNISASDLLWESSPSPSSYFQYKVGWYSGEEGAFNWSGSQNTWANVPETNTTFIDYLNYTSGNSTFDVDLAIEVPPDEPPGTKSATIVFTGWYFVA